jgi:hypothetical protein
MGFGIMDNYNNIELIFSVIMIIVAVVIGFIYDN